MVEQPTIGTPPQRSGRRGQALVEYALILVLVVMALIAAVAATGPALGNVFSNTVFNLVGITGQPQDLYAKGGPTAFWLTVTYVAANPPAARVFPTGQPPLPSPTYTAGPSPTATPVTPSSTPIPTATLPPTATATDAPFDVPFSDSIDQPVWWRVDSSVYLGGADWKGEYYPNKTLTEPADRVLYNQALGPEYRFNVNFNWGNGSPLDGWLTDNFSVRYTRVITVDPNPVTLHFTMDSDDGSRLLIDGVKVLDYWYDHGLGSPREVTQTLSAGTHTLVVEMYEAGGGAGVSLAIAADKANVAADVNKGGGSVVCPWTQITGSQPNTVAYAWKENLATVSNGFPQNMRCNLELRGYVDLNGVASPSMSFWDVWDFGSATDTSVKLQLAEYVPYNADLSGGPNWAGGTTSTYVLHTTGKNYAWTKSEMPIPAGLLNKKVTWRYIMESGTQNSVRRWYLDDIKLGAGTTNKTFGVCTISKFNCGNFWSLDIPDQQGDFVTSGRWALTNTTAASNDLGGPSMSWDVTSGANGNNGNYVDFGNEQGTTALDNRIHYVEFKGKVDLQAIGPTGSGGTPDWEGDSGYPILSFYQAYSLERGDSIEIQYTRDSDTPGTPANWQRVGVSAIKSVSTSGSAISDGMKKIEIQLKDIPNWNTQPFRLRFALIVNKDYESSGWYIDNIAIEREGVLRYGNYPFCDDAESGTDNWLMGGQWGVANTSGAFGTGRSFSDSPVGNYIHGQVSSMMMRYPIDFNNDTPENLSLWGGNKSCFNGSNSGAASQPILSFWHWRKLAASDSFRIELYRGAKPSGTTSIGPVMVWDYPYSGGNSSQVVWERQEVDMRAAIEKATGLKWSVLTSNADKYDDDFFVYITFDGSVNTSVSDGIYIDNIEMKEYSESSYKLWATNVNYVAKTGAPVAGNGNGTDWVDDIDNPGDWYNRWTTAGPWGAITWDSRSGVASMHDSDSSGQRYQHQSYNVLEMNKILDLRGTKNTDLPTMYFWHHYNVGNSDSISVEIAVQDETEMTAASPPRNRMGYDYRYLWGSATSYSASSSWQSIWSIGQNNRNDAWVREQIDLRNYVGKRLKVRFVLNAYADSNNLGEGWWLDNIQFVFRTAEVFTVGFNDPAQNMRYWIPEGRWGLAPDQWRGTGGGPAELGTNPWTVFWFDCITWVKNSTQPGPNASYLNESTCSSGNWNTFFDNVTRTVAGTNAWISARPSLVAGQHYIKDFTDVISYDFGTTGRPGTLYDTWYDQYGGRFMRDITVTGGEYTFITTSDDGIRVRVENSDGSVPSGFTSTFWNVINRWNTHSSTVDYQAVTLVPGNYRIIMEYFESTSGAVAQLQVGTNKFSFSDSPKAGAGSSFPVVNSIPYSSSSLIMNGVLNLDKPSGYTTAQWKPRLEFYTLYDFPSSSTGAVQVSTDGGFTWTQTGLNATCPAALNSGQCNPNMSGNINYTPSGGYDWQLRSYDLSSWVNQNIIVRFRLTTGSGTRDGWWITDIVVGNNGT